MLALKLVKKREGGGKHTADCTMEHAMSSIERGIVVWGTHAGNQVPVVTLFNIAAGVLV